MDREVDPGKTSVFATSLAQQTSFAFTCCEDRRTASLHAFGARPVSQLYQAPIPIHARLARDSSSRHVIATVLDDERLHVVPLGPAPPNFPQHEPELNSLELPIFTGCTYAIAGETILVTAGELRGYSERSAMAGWSGRSRRPRWTSLQS